jgi:hypothetical protein
MGEVRLRRADERGMWRHLGRRRRVHEQALAHGVALQLLDQVPHPGADKQTANLHSSAAFAPPQGLHKAERRALSAPLFRSARCRGLNRARRSYLAASIEFLGPIVGGGGLPPTNGHQQHIALNSEIQEFELSSQPLATFFASGGATRQRSSA